MYSSVLTVPPYDYRPSQFDPKGYSIHPSQFNVRSQQHANNSYYNTARYDAEYRSTASREPFEYYSGQQYGDQPSRCRSAVGSQSSPQQLGLDVRRSDPCHLPIQSNYAITKGIRRDTYLYEPSDIYSISEYDETTTISSLAPSPSLSPALSTDSLITMKSPLPSPITEEDGTSSTRRSYISIQAQPLPKASNTIYSSRHEEILRSTDHTPRDGHLTVPIQVSTHTLVQATDPRSQVAGLLSQSSSAHLWPHAIPTNPPSEADTEDVSLEARLNAKYNAVSTAVYYATNTRGIDSRNATGPQTHLGSATGMSNHPSATNDRQGSSNILSSPRSSIGSSDSTSTIVDSQDMARANHAHHRDSKRSAEHEAVPHLSFAGGSRSDGAQNQLPGYPRTDTTAGPTEYPSVDSYRSKSTSDSAAYGSSPPQKSIQSGDALQSEEPVSVTASSSRPRRNSNTGPPGRPPPLNGSTIMNETMPVLARSEEHIKTGFIRRRSNSIHISETVSSSPAPSLYTTPAADAGVQPPNPISSIDEREHHLAPKLGSTKTSSSPTEHVYPTRATFSNEIRNHSQSFVPPTESRNAPTSSTYNINSPYRSQSTANDQQRPQASRNPDPYYPTLNSQRGAMMNYPTRPQGTAPPSTYTSLSPEPYSAQSTSPFTNEYQTNVSGFVTPENAYRSQDVSQPPRVDHVRHTAPPKSQSNSTGSWANLGSRMYDNASPPRMMSMPTPRVGSRPISPSMDLSANQARQDKNGRDERGSPPSALIGHLKKGQKSPPNTQNSLPTPIYSTHFTTSPEMHPALSQDICNLDPAHSETAGKGRPRLSIRNPSPSDSSTEAPGSPRIHVPFPGPHRRLSDGDRQSKGLLSSKRETPAPEAGESRIHGSQARYQSSAVPVIPEYPRRRYSDGDQSEGPSISLNNGRASAPPTRTVRWTEDLVCPSPVFPVRRKGWFNRRGDQLWTNRGNYKPPASGHEYPPDLDDYPEYGEGWMNEEGVRIDMTHRLIPKVPLRSALKQPRS